MTLKLKLKKEFYNFNSNNIENEIIELKKELILLKTKKKTKQTIKTHTIKEIKYKISQMLRLEKRINQ